MVTKRDTHKYIKLRFFQGFLQNVLPSNDMVRQRGHQLSLLSFVTKATEFGDLMICDF